MSAITHVAAAYRMASNDLGRRYPLVVFYLAFCGIISAVEFCNWHNQAVYARVAVATMPLAFLIQLLAIVQVFWVIVEQYPNFRKAGMVGIALLAVGSEAVAWIGSHFGRVASRTGVDILIQCHCCLALALLLAGIAIFLPRSPDLPVRKSAFRAAIIMGVDATLFGATSAIHLATAPYAGAFPLFVRELMTLSSMFVGIFTGLLWLLWMTPESHAVQAAEPITDAERWELMLLKVRLRPRESR